jgi:hypothetical protein
VGYDAGAIAPSSKSSGTSWQIFPRLRSGPDMPMPRPSSQRRVDPSVPLFTLDPLFPVGHPISSSLLDLTPNAPSIDPQSYLLFLPIYPEIEYTHFNQGPSGSRDPLVPASLTLKMDSVIDLSDKSKALDLNNIRYQLM